MSIYSGGSKQITYGCQSDSKKICLITILPFTIVCFLNIIILLGFLIQTRAIYL